MGQFRAKQRVCTRTRGNDSAASSELGTRHHRPIPLPCNSPEGRAANGGDTRGPRKNKGDAGVCTENPKIYKSMRNRDWGGDWLQNRYLKSTAFLYNTNKRLEVFNYK